MAAHLRPLPRCNRYGCDRPATAELYNAVNSPSGVFCAQHAKAELAAFKKRVGET